ncbi:MAG: rRNA maturation RNase YbeY [Clostridiales bacterium]|nr:rRNA maturation RNase YbeY [Clostridiales bacterium]
MKIKITHDYQDIKNTKYVDSIKEYNKTIQKCVKYCIEEEDIKTSNNIEIYIRYTNNQEIKIINNEYRNIDRPTDVLSFPMYEPYEVKQELENNKMPINQLGDIIISIEKTKEQAEEYGHAFERELIYLITHAMFHLLGYDHMEDDEKKIMRDKEEKIMDKLNIKR